MIYCYLKMYNCTSYQLNEIRINIDNLKSSDANTFSSECFNYNILLIHSTTKRHWKKNTIRHSIIIAIIGMYLILRYVYMRSVQPSIISIGAIAIYISISHRNQTRYFILIRIRLELLLKLYQYWPLELSRKVSMYLLQCATRTIEKIIIIMCILVVYNKYWICIANHKSKL